VSQRVVASIVVERRAASFGSTYSVSNTVGHLHPSRSRIGWEHGVKARPGVCGCPVKPRATSLDRKSEGINQVNPPSSATGVTRGGKSPSRVLPAEGGRIRTSSPQPRSESAGGADRSPEGDPPRRRGQTRESGDAGYARSTTSSSRSDRRETYPTPRRRCRIYNGSRSGIANSWL